MSASTPSGVPSILWERRAVKELEALPRDAQHRIVSTVENLRENPLSGKPLSGEWRGLRRLRAGSYRVIYAFDGTRILITILRVGHRSHVYRR